MSCRFRDGGGILLPQNCLQPTPSPYKPLQADAIALPCQRSPPCCRPLPTSSPGLPPSPQGLGTSDFPAFSTPSTHSRAVAQGLLCPCAGTLPSSPWPLFLIASPSAFTIICLELMFPWQPQPAPGSAFSASLQLKDRSLWPHFPSISVPLPLRRTPVPKTHFDLGH